MWRSTLPLLRFMETQMLGGARILELGSGTGALGIALATLQPPPSEVRVPHLGF
jgi:tRNA1(Val) A37 N6-methylase TrmN6